MKFKTYKIPEILIPFDEPLVRVGNTHDGGYLISQTNTNKNNLLTFGVGNEWEFENQWIKNNHNAVHSYDGTINTQQFSRAELKSFYNVYKKHRIFHNENVTIHNIDHIFDTADNIFLKCDIEGAEYKILDHIAKNHKIDQLVMEFHWLVTDNKMIRFLDFVEKMSEHYNLIHIHANNNAYNANHKFADVVEITMLKKTLCTSQSKRKFIYHKLDKPCDQFNDTEIILET